ncbi:MAG: hypothetical protein L6R35_002615 [Caloplaca aegaea]|nr:MAG: hypothetical protein L6R35_002615 [Caloplaca aegaea]
MNELFESVDPFIILNCLQWESSLADLEALHHESLTDRLSPFGMLHTVIIWISSTDGIVLATSQETGPSLLALPYESVALPALDLSRDDPLQASKAFVGEQNNPVSFPYGPLENIEPFDQSSASSDGEERGLIENPLEDIWCSQEVLEPTVRKLEIKSWDGFYDKSFREPCVPYISEAGPRVLDAALYSDLFLKEEVGFRRQPAPALRLDATLSGLIQLALGRESLLFRYDEQASTFRPVLEPIRASGYTMECFQSALAMAIIHGNQLQQTRRFIRTVYDSRSTTVASVALASAIEIVLTALETQLSGPLASTRTILQLQCLLDPSRTLLSRLSNMINKTIGVEDDGELLSLLFNLIQDFECSLPSFQPVMEQLLAHTSRPLLESIETLLGWNRSGEVFAGRVGAAVEAGGLWCRKTPNFIYGELAENILEAEQSLKLLQNHEPNHPLARRHSLSDQPSLQWEFSWPDIEKIQARAYNYELDVLKALKEYNTSDSLGAQQTCNVQRACQNFASSSADAPRTPFDFLSQIDSSISTLLVQTPSSLSTTVAQTLCNGHQRGDPFNKPPTALLPNLSFQPPIAAQSRLLAHSALRLLFGAGSLRFHLRLLHSYHLIADGPFLVRLSQALFDPSLPSAAYQKGRNRNFGSAGLQLGSREMAWPPASSELRIALMGILTDSYHESFHGKILSERVGERGELPGDLSFAIRSDMSDAELEKCMNRDGLEALDFLKVQYRPPKPLDTVITESVLEKYERLSRLLLRGARLQFTVKSLVHDRRANMQGRKAYSGSVQRFKIEALHFVMTVFGYFGDCIEESWAAFEKRLDGIEDSVNHYEVGRQAVGVHRLRDVHEEVLDRILAGCLLRKRQELVMRLLEEILGSVLGFAKCMRDRRDGNEWEGEVSKLYGGFRKKVRVFITVCKGLQDQKSMVRKKDLFDGGKRGQERGNGIGRLVLGLEMSGWYMR